MSFLASWKGLRAGGMNGMWASQGEASRSIFGVSRVCLRELGLHEF